ncbi:hypothetical protein APUTEX25_002710 [Auxenochlorella protothecoides]|uniref:ABC transporter domain-containing protein n=1 Tax=Auxenochlorella protothecoides TaxID=3075 RepID=A0A3M7L1J7_AUXPR|nr:hypothetical protein APUTEX25_002710 [Auxenochlorella protothecoides]|eukprot:RMZ56621.1 hypothetical protein APUTEX25_002710 [Auxenochlorella protothecoides]
MSSTVVVVAPSSKSAVVAQLALLLGVRKSTKFKLGIAAATAGLLAYHASRSLRQDRRSLSGRPEIPRPKKSLATGSARKPRPASQRRALQRLLPLLLRVAGPKVVVLLGVVLARTALSNRLARLQGYLFRAAFLKRVPLFMRNLAENVALCALAAGLESTSRSWVSRLELQWRRLLTQRVHAAYFDDMVYYKLSYVDRRIPSAEQRICEDIPALTEGLASLLGELLSAGVDAAFYSWALHSYTGTHRYTALLLAYVVGVGGAMAFAAPNFGGLFKRQAALEGAYRAVHTRLRANIESVAFYAGMHKEGEVVRGAFRDSLRAQRRLLGRQWQFGMVQDLLLKYFGATVALALILGPFFGGHLRPEATVRGRAGMLSAMRYHTSVTISLFGALGTLGGASRKLMRLQAYAERLAELEAVMAEIAGGAGMGSEGLPPARGQLLACEDAIAFESVVVVTPANATLVRDLTLRVPAGTNLLVTGPNGAGKSSLFRVLGGLWPLTAGAIRKPGGGAGDAAGGLSHEIFYVPQRPYVTVGTLQEQLLYPLTPGAGGAAPVIPDDELADLLASVDLGHLLARGGESLDWGEELSLGEQQRLGMARLFYHRPRFAILDECTSGVSVDMERRFCSMVRDAGCTCITISHRPALMAFHDLVLALDGEGGWSVHAGHRALGASGAGRGGAGPAGGGGSGASGAPAPTPMLSGSVDAEASARVRSAEASAVLAGMTAGGEGRRESAVPERAASDSDASSAELEVVARAPSRSAIGGAACAADWSPCRALRPGPLSTLARWRLVGGVLLGRDPRGSALGLGAVAGVVALRTLLQDRIANLNGEAVHHVLRQDVRSFLWLLGVSAAQGCASAVLAPSLRHIADLLALSWRARLTRAASDRYLAPGATGYTAVQLAGLGDVDQRLTRDVERLSRDLAALIPTLVKPVLDITWFSARLWAMTGRRGAAILYLYAALGYGTLRLLTPDFGALLRREYELEGGFRGAHSRLRTHAESVAFFGGGAREGGAVVARFDAMTAHLRGLIAQRWAYGTADEFFSKQLPHNVTWVLTLLYSLDQQDDLSDDMVQGHLVHQIRYLASVVTSSFSAFGDLLAMPRKFAEISGGIARVSEMFQVLDAASRFDSRASLAELEGALPDSIEFRNADILTPGGRMLARDLSFRVTPGHPLLVTGPNGLFRILSGLWPLAAGAMHRPGAAGAGLDSSDIYYVPQRPYTTIGTLRDQIIYPLTARQAYQRYSITDSSEDAAQQLDAELDDLMGVVHLKYLVSREGGWDASREWGETLSLGEQQRVGMARLFFHKPRFGILDECTNATSVDVEESLYQHATSLGITLITISQRTALVKYHEHELRLLDGQGGWELRKLRA